MRSGTIAKLIGVAILIFAVVIAFSSASYVVDPGFRGVEVTLGKVAPGFKGEGFGWKTPFITHIVPISVRQQTHQLTAECYSSDLQQVKTELSVLYRLPESSVVKIYQQYSGDPFDSLIAPRVQEALKEVTATESAEQIVKGREAIKSKALAAAQVKVGDILVIVDVVIQNIDLSHELETAIEAKMVQEQEAAKAKFTQQKAQIEADTVVIKAKGDAESIKIRGEALKQTPAFIDLQIVEKWDGKAPLVFGGNSGGVNMLLPLADLQKQREASQAAASRPMNPRYALILKLLGAIFLIVLLAALFPPVMEFVEMAARELRYFWWLIFLVLIAVWLIWGLGRGKK